MYLLWEIWIQLYKCVIGKIESWLEAVLMMDTNFLMLVSPINILQVMQVSTCGIVHQMLIMMLWEAFQSRNIMFASNFLVWFIHVQILSILRTFKVNHCLLPKPVADPGCRGANPLWFKHGIMTYNSWMFSLPHFPFQYKPINIFTVLTSKPETCVYVWIPVY